MPALSTFTRRGFLLQATAVAAPMFIPRVVFGANQKVGIGAIGVGHRASLLLSQLPEDARIVALCDCNLPRAEAFCQKASASWPVVQNYRKLLDRTDVDAVVIGTREHQRVLPCVHACQAGKDVYAEKPLTLYIREGRVLVDAVRKHKRVLQVGSQQRSMEMNRIACRFIREGRLGKLREVRAVNYTFAGPPPRHPCQPNPCRLAWTGTCGSTRPRGGPTTAERWGARTILVVGR